MCGSCILHGRLSESKTLLPWVSKTLDGWDIIDWQSVLFRWLGQNSKATKFKRLLTDMRSQMRLQTSANAHEIRENYVPTMTKRIFNYLENVCVSSLGKDSSFTHMMIGWDWRSYWSHGFILYATWYTGHFEWTLFGSQEAYERDDRF